MIRDVARGGVGVDSEFPLDLLYLKMTIFWYQIQTSPGWNPGPPPPQTLFPGSITYPPHHPESQSSLDLDQAKSWLRHCLEMYECVECLEMVDTNFLYLPKRGLNMEARVNILKTLFTFEIITDLLLLFKSVRCKLKQRYRVNLTG